MTVIHTLLLFAILETQRSASHSLIVLLITREAKHWSPHLLSVHSVILLLVFPDSFFKQYTTEYRVVSSFQRYCASSMSTHISTQCWKVHDHQLLQHTPFTGNGGSLWRLSMPPGSCDVEAFWSDFFLVQTFVFSCCTVVAWVLRDNCMWDTPGGFHLHCQCVAGALCARTNDSLCVTCEILKTVCFLCKCVMFLLV